MMLKTCFITSCPLLGHGKQSNLVEPQQHDESMHNSLPPVSFVRPANLDRLKVDAVAPATHPQSLRLRPGSSSFDPSAPRTAGQRARVQHGPLEHGLGSVLIMGRQIVPKRCVALPTVTVAQVCVCCGQSASVDHVQHAIPAVAAFPSVSGATFRTIDKISQVGHKSALPLTCRVLAHFLHAI